MSSISLTPSQQEIEQQVEQIAAHILKNALPSNVAAIAAYGSCILEKFKPETSILVGFYHAFVSVPKNGYDGFVARFDNDDDAIAVHIATQLMKVVRS